LSETLTATEHRERDVDLKGNVDNEGPLIRQMSFHQAQFEDQELAFGSNLAQASEAIFVLACLSATRPILGPRFESPTTTRLFVAAPDLRADF